MPKKRKSSNLDCASKRKKVSLRKPRPKSKPFPLLSLPSEIIDTILSHIIRVPLHPFYGSFSFAAIYNLFPRATFHINTYLRQRSIDFVARNVLWMEVTWRDRVDADKMNLSYMGLALLPTVYKDLLPKSLSKIHLEVGDPRHELRGTRSQKEKTVTALFPFNFSSFAMLSTRLSSAARGCSDRWIRPLTIRPSNLTASHQIIFDQQVVPMAPLYQLDVNVTIAVPGREPKVLPRISSYGLPNAHPQIDRVMDIVQSLDEVGRKLEATLVCMYYGWLIRNFVDRDPWVGSMAIWANPGGPLNRPNWETQWFNLWRMKRVRSLHYIEYRACLGYIAAVQSYGYRFCSREYRTMANLTGFARWGACSNRIWFGLPDHELAEMHHAKALIYYHIWEHLERFEADMLLGPNRIYDPAVVELKALTWAYYAWSLDTGNDKIRLFFLHLIRSFSANVKEQMRQREIDFRDELQQEGLDNFGVHFSVFDEWLTEGSAITYLDRARNAAKLADVQYDKRRGHELPRGYVKESRQAQDRLLYGSLADKDRKRKHPRGKLYTDAIEFEEGRDFLDFSDVAPWRDWMP